MPWSGFLHFIRGGLAPFLAILLLAIWLGGFTFYSSFVIPVLHARMGSTLEAGLVTREVTGPLNLLGLAAVTAGVLAAILEPSGCRSAFRSALSLTLLLVTALCLTGLFALRQSLGRRLDANELAGFYPAHRVYLWLSTGQWAVNVALLAIWSRRRLDPPERRLPENPQVSDDP